MTMHEVRLTGCRTEPLAAYLKGLGVLRIVGAQADCGARGWWRDDCFVLRSRLEGPELIDFFVDRYAPTPVVAPWNNGSGFKGGTSPGAVKVLATIESSTDSRLATLRETIATARRILADVGTNTKAELITRCRAELPDEAIAWIDAAVVLTADDETYPPLLGTGGNDGRLDFSKAFLDRLIDVLCLRTGRGAPDRDRSCAWLQEALFGDAEVALLSDVVGQFDPGAAGGPNSAPTGAAPSLVNPWDWVLLIEGALVFASAAARRLGSGSARSAVPFTVGPTPAGYGTSAEENTRGEFWAPLWRRPATATEVGHLAGEGRIEWRRAQARNGLDAARAVATLGVQRGIDCFVRHALVERNGLATAAVPVGRFRSRNEPAVAVTAQLDPWFDRVRRGSSQPNAVHDRVQSVEHALLEHARRPGPGALQELLRRIADLELAVAAARGFRERAVIRPVRGLRSPDWLPFLDDGSDEFDLARALASARETSASTLALAVRPVSDHERGRLGWRDGGALVTGLGRRGIQGLLADAMQRRAVAAMQTAGEDRDGTTGLSLDHRWYLPARASSVAAWCEGAVDEGRLERLVRALLILDWEHSGREDPDSAGELPLLPTSYLLLAPFFHGATVQRSGERTRLRVAVEWPRQLASGQVENVVAAAIRRLRQFRLSARATDTTVIASCSPRGEHLAAVLSVPIGRRTARSLLRTVARSNPSNEQ